MFDVQHPVKLIPAVLNSMGFTHQQKAYRFTLTDKCTMGRMPPIRSGGLTSMIKKLKLTTFTFIFTLNTAISFAGGPGIYGTYIDTEDLEESYGAGAKLDINVTQNLIIQARSAFYDTLGQDMIIGTSEIQADLNIVPVEVGMTYDLTIADRVIPYIGGGLGWYILEADVVIDGDAQSVNIDDELGYYLRGGLRLDPGQNLSIFGEYQYRQVDTTLPDDSFERRVRGEVDVGLSGSSINVGLMLRW